jgi:WhiB family redox-sensing transcriptional regulator
MTKYYSVVSELWRDKASCKEVGVDIFFAETEQRTREQINKSKIAKAMCSQCKVQAECLSYALNNKIDYGIWGGFTSRERKNICTIFKLKSYTTPLTKTIINKTIANIKEQNQQVKL